VGAGRERVKLQGRVQGGVPRHPGPRGSGVWALSSAALSAWGGSRLPRSCGARAARCRERRGKQQARREGARGTAGGRDAGAAPGPPGFGAPGPTVRDSLGPRGQRRIPRPLAGQVTCPTPVSRVLGCCYERSGNPWLLSLGGLFPSVTRTSRDQPRSGWAIQAPSSPPLLTLPVRPLASDPPSPLASSVHRIPRMPGWGEGESFRAPQLPALSPSPGPRPAPLPADHSPDRGCPALGTRSSNGSVASSSFALTRLSFPFGVPGPLRPGLLLQARCPMLRSPVARGPPLSQLLGPTPPPSVQLCSRRPLPESSCSPRGPFSQSQMCARSVSKGLRLSGDSAAPDRRSAPGLFPEARLSPRCAGDLRARPSPVLIPQTRRPLPPRRGAPPGGRPGPRRAAAARSPLCAPPDWSAPGAQAPPASSSLPLAAAAAAGTVSPVGTSGFNSSPAGQQPGDLGRPISSVGDRRRAEELWVRRQEAGRPRMGTPAFPPFWQRAFFSVAGTRESVALPTSTLGVLEFGKTTLPKSIFKGSRIFTADHS
jgi:hypothetical protein